MNVRNLIPWGRSDTQTPTTYQNEPHPVLSLHREVNRLFDDIFRDFNAGVPSFGRFPALDGVWPKLEISEADKEIRVTAEIPGLDKKDIEVVLEDEVLTLRGEKRSETNDKDRQFSERFYGRFERHIPLRGEIETEKVKADFSNGLLTVTLPKSESTRAKTKRIEIK